MLLHTAIATAFDLTVGRIEDDADGARCDRLEGTDLTVAVSLFTATRLNIL
jgi:hypothetical protein